jgi:hypothetical protein
MNSHINNYANFITKQKRVENSGLLRSGPVQLDEFYDDDYGDKTAAAAATAGALAGGAAGATAGYYGMMAIGQPHMAMLGGFLGGAVGGAAGVAGGLGLKYSASKKLKKLKAKKQLHVRSELDKHTHEQKEAAVNYIGDALEEKHGVTVHRGKHDHIYVEGGPLKKNEYISFHDTHGMEKYKIPSYHEFRHHTFHKFTIGTTGETKMVEKTPYEYSHEDFHRAVDHMDKYLHSLKLRNARESNGSQ